MGRYVLNYLNYLLVAACIIIVAIFLDSVIFVTPDRKPDEKTETEIEFQHYDIENVNYNRGIIILKPLDSKNPYIIVGTDPSEKSDFLLQLSLTPYKNKSP